MIRRAQSKIIFIIFLAFMAFFSVILSCKIGTIHFTFKEVLKGLFIRDDSLESLIIFKIRLPRIIIGGMVGICLSLSGCILQGVMRNHLASPTTIGVTSGASFVGYLTLVAFPAYAYLLSVVFFITIHFSLIFSANIAVICVAFCCEIAICETKFD